MAPALDALATSVGLLGEESGTDRVVAAPPKFWAENDVHLPQMIATRWLALREWHEQGGMVAEGSPVELALPHLRPVALLWLAKLAETEWPPLDDLADHLDRLAPGWHHPTLPHPDPVPAAPDRPGVLASILLGPAYQLGLVRTAEEDPSGRRVVQLTPLGRYTLALGPPPGPRESFEHFLFVQPNLEVVAYRQGLSPGLIGEFSQFARWSQIGAALELKLTPESVYQGLEGGLTPDAMLDRLSSHSARGIPPSVADAVRTWASRRERVTYYASATLVELADPLDAERALAEWPVEPGSSGPVPITDRLLLVEDPKVILFAVPMAGRGLPPPARAARPRPSPTASPWLPGPRPFRPARRRRAGRGSPTSCPRPRPVAGSASRPSRWRRALEAGLTPTTLSRAGSTVPPASACRRRSACCSTPPPGPEPIAASRPLVLSVPSESLLDGLLQHPDTAPYLGDRLGPAAVVVVESLWPGREVLEALGLPFSDGEDAPRNARARRS